jgi:hypothetical protein
VAHSKIALLAILEWGFSRLLKRHTSPFAILLEKFVALRRRTDGKFLNAAPSANETDFEKYPEKTWVTHSKIAPFAILE